MRSRWIGFLCATTLLIVIGIWMSVDVYRLTLGTFIPRQSISTGKDLDNQQCKEEARHLYFLKVHKAGSTSMQNVFLRFALERKLNVLTLFKGKFMSYPRRTFDILLPPLLPKSLVKGKYDIYCEHSIFHEEYLMTKLHTDTVNIAIVREPMPQLRSTFEFYELAKRMSLEEFPDPVAEFLENPDYYGKSAVTKAVTQNRVSKEFGLKSDNPALIEYLEYIDSKFLVLIMEKLSESLIVMKRKLCWGMKEILTAQARRGSYLKPKVNETLVNLHKAWSPLDYAFYDYFTNVMDKTIAAQNNDFHGEVALFEEHLARTREFCDEVCTRMGTLVKPYVDRESITSVLHNKTRFAESQWSSGFDITGLDCVMMRIDPRVFRDIQKVRLFPEFCSHNNSKIAKLDINPRYCRDLFEDTIPWTTLKNPTFASDCY